MSAPYFFPFQLDASSLIISSLLFPLRILNLFSRDIYVIDEVLIRTFSGFFRTLASVGGVLVIIGFGAPVVLLGVIPVGLVYRSIMKYYLATSRELKRLDATSRAPIFRFVDNSHLYLRRGHD